MSAGLDPGVYSLTPEPSGPPPIPLAALAPWPDDPPQGECYAQPARWAELRALRDPVPEWFEGTTGMASWHRAAGQHVEQALRASPLDFWHYDPELPLSLIMSGLPRWNRDGRRRDTGENAWQFARLVGDYEQELAAGTVFPPLYVYAFEPSPDRPVLGAGQLARYTDWHWTDRPHYVISNGRHRAIAAWRSGLRAFPSFVLGPAREIQKVNDRLGTGRWLSVPFGKARDWGRAGHSLDTLKATGPVRVEVPEDGGLDRLEQGP